MLVSIGSAVVLVVGFALGQGPGDAIRLNQIQVIGTHNSYHIAAHPNVLGLVAATSKRTAEGLDYTHRPLAEQFSELGIRQVELDVFADPQGGLFAEPSARKILKKLGKDPGPDPDDGGKLRAPGLKVLHVPDVDFRTTAVTFKDALGQIRAWSQAYPAHVPIFVLVELKDDAIPALPTRPVKFGKAELDSVDAEIRSVFRPSEIFTPDDVRGDAPTLREAILSKGWPKLDDVRGKVFFGLDNEDEHRELYLEGHPTLENRVMFASVAREHPAAGWMKVNDAVEDFARIRDLVASGFLVRTRADSDTTQSRQNDPTRRDKALASGAQFVSTDYPEPRLDFSPYEVRLPGKVVARANPVSAGPVLRDGDLEARRGH